MSFVVCECWANCKNRQLVLEAMYCTARKCLGLSFSLASQVSKMYWQEKLFKMLKVVFKIFRLGMETWWMWNPNWPKQPYMLLWPRHTVCRPAGAETHRIWLTSSLCCIFLNQQLITNSCKLICIQCWRMKKEHFLRLLFFQIHC